MSRTVARAFAAAVLVLSPTRAADAPTAKPWTADQRSRLQVLTLRQRNIDLEKELLQRDWDAWAAPLCASVDAKVGIDCDIDFQAGTVQRKPAPDKK